jgi:predicted Zn-dependent protease with MMP-like domain
MDHLNEIAEKADEAIFSSNQEEMKQLILTLEKRLDDKITSDIECYTRYILGNLYHGMLSATQEDPS